MPTLWRGHFIGSSRDRHVPGRVCFTHKTNGLPKYLSFVPLDDPCRVAANEMFAHDEARKLFQWMRDSPGPKMPNVLNRGDATSEPSTHS